MDSYNREKSQAQQIDVMPPLANTHEFRKALFKRGSGLWRDPLTKTTRDRQKYLLLLSVVTLLLAVAVISPKQEGTLLGLKFTIANGEVLPLLFSIVTFFVLLLFVVGAYPELRADYLRAGIVVFEFQALLNATLESNEKKKNTIVELQEKMSRLSAEKIDALLKIKNIHNKYFEMSERLYAQLREIGSESLEPLSKGEQRPSLGDLTISNKRASELIAREEGLHRQFDVLEAEETLEVKTVEDLISEKDREYTALRGQIEEILESNWGQTEIATANKLLDQALIYRKVRSALEIIVPALFAVFVIGLAAFRYFEPRAALGGGSVQLF